MGLCWSVNANFLPFLPSLLCSLQVDVSVADPTSIQGRALRVVTHTVHVAAGYTPFVGGQIRRLMIEIVSASPSSSLSFSFLHSLPLSPSPRVEVYVPDLFFYPL